MTLPIDEHTEWLEADGLGGFASGTATLVRTRRYHAALLASATPPTGRFVLVSGVDASIETSSGTYALTSQKYTPGVLHPQGAMSIVGFTCDPWPTWTVRLPDGTEIEHELFVVRGAALTAMSWRLRKSRRDCGLVVRPFLAGRDYHALTRRNQAVQLAPQRRGDQYLWTLYNGVPGIACRSSGSFSHSADWYTNFQYDEERRRGLECVEDLPSPGVFRFDLPAPGDGEGRAVLLFAAAGIPGGATDLLANPAPVGAVYRELRERERRRREAQRRAHPLAAAADAYVVQRGAGNGGGGGGRGEGAGRTIIAGYPWFTDWGRDTFISMRGLCLATGRLDEAKSILLEWAGHVSEGMLPNRFPDAIGQEPEYNAVDASLWYVIAVGEYLEAAQSGRSGHSLAEADERRLRGAVTEILRGYGGGTRYGIRVDSDGLLAAGVPGGGLQLTWMDAKCGDWVVTPRIGKPVEAQALWGAALRVGARFDSGWSEALARLRGSFESKFWNAGRGCLYDVVDVDHVPGTHDARVRPNQVFAAGGLPVPLLNVEKARAVVDVVERMLLTPMGLRSLAPDEPGYRARYEGGPSERDGAYHQGTVWPWLLGPFVEAWVRVRGGSDEAKAEARRRFLDPILSGVDQAAVGGVGHIAEIADAEAPHAARGCPFQAWSVAEAIRLDRAVLAPGAAQRPAGARRHAGR